MLKKHLILTVLLKSEKKNKWRGEEDVVDTNK